MGHPLGKHRRGALSEPTHCAASMGTGVVARSCLYQVPQSTAAILHFSRRQAWISCRAAADETGCDLQRGLTEGASVMIYSPKRDWWVAVLILTIGAIQLSGACLLVVAAIRMHEPGILVPAAVLMAVAFFLLWIWSSSSYEIMDNDLVIRFGPLPC